MKKMLWERVTCFETADETSGSLRGVKPGELYELMDIGRALVPGGWLVKSDTSILFLSDPEHVWLADQEPKKPAKTRRHGDRG